MSIDLPPSLERRLRHEAERRGLDVADYAIALLERWAAADKPNARELLAMSVEDRRSYLATAAEDAAPLYEEDINKPPFERELTALTCLDGEPIHDDVI